MSSVRVKVKTWQCRELQRNKTVGFRLSSEYSSTTDGAQNTPGVTPVGPAKLSVGEIFAVNLSMFSDLWKIFVNRCDVLRNYFLITYITTDYQGRNHLITDSGKNGVIVSLPPPLLHRKWKPFHSGYGILSNPSPLRLVLHKGLKYPTSCLTQWLYLCDFIPY